MLYMYLRFQIRCAVRTLDRVLVDLGLAVRTDLGRDLRLWLRSRTVQPVHTLSPFFPYRHLLFRTAVLCEEVVDTVRRIEQVTDRAIVI